MSRKNTVKFQSVSEKCFLRKAGVRIMGMVFQICSGTARMDMKGNVVRRLKRKILEKYTQMPRYMIYCE